MNRSAALSRLHDRLASQRAELRRTLHDDLRSLADGDRDALYNDATVSIITQAEARQLDAVEDALARMRRGEYGVCEECGRSIALARLEAVPYAALCVSCQEASEAPFSGRHPCRASVALAR